MVKILAIILEIIAILYFTGYGISSFLLPKKLHKDSFFIIPWLGLVMITLLSVDFSLIKIPIEQSKYLVIAISTAVLIYAFYKNKLIKNFSKETIIVSLFTFFALIYYMFPLLTKIGFPTTTSYGNLDPLSYVNVSEFLIHKTVYDGGLIEMYKPHLIAVGDLLHYSYRWGSPMILGFFSSILNLRAYQIYSIVLNLLFALTFPLVYLLAKQICQKKGIILVSLIFLTFAINPIMLYMLYNVFFAQFIFGGVFVLSVLFFYDYLSDKNTDNWKWNSYDILLGLVFSSITSIYPEGIVFAFIPLGLFFCLKLVKTKKISAIIPFFKVLITTIVLNPLTFGYTLKWNIGVFLLTTKTGFIGWEKIRYATPLELTGVYNLFYYKNLNNRLDLITSIPVVIVFLIGLYKAKNKLIISSYLLLFGLFYILYRFFIPNYYTHLKTVSFMLFTFSIIFSFGMIKFFEFFRSKLFFITSLIVFVLLIFRSSYRTFYQMYFHGKVVDKSLISLIKLNNNKKINQTVISADVYLGEYDIWRRFWQEYFLYDKKIISLSNYSTLVDKVPKKKYVLSEKKLTEFDHKKITYKKIIWENDYYQLGEINVVKKIK